MKTHPFLLFNDNLPNKRADLDRRPFKKPFKLVPIRTSMKIKLVITNMECLILDLPHSSVNAGTPMVSKGKLTGYMNK